MRASLLLLLSSLFGCFTPQLVDHALPPAPANLRAAFDGMSAPAQARVRVLDDNIDAWVARMNVLEAAKHTLDVQYFIIEPDAFGLSLLAMLAEKARAGVKVRLMVDARGSAGIIRGSQRFLLQEVQRAGADVRVYNPILFQITETMARGDLRAVAASNHDKLLIADGRVVVAGGRNMSRDYLSDPNDQANAFIDMDLLYEGESAAAVMTEAFVAEFDAKRTTPLMVEARGDGRTALALTVEAMRLWLNDAPFTVDELVAFDAASPTARDTERDAIALVIEGALVAAQTAIPADEVRATLRQVTRLLAREARLRGARTRAVPMLPDDAVDVRVLDTHSSEGALAKNTVNDGLLAAVQSAEKELIIQSPYFVLTSRGMRAIEQAGARGVSVIILTNSPASSDSPPTQAAFLRQWPELLARVPNARLFVVAEGRLMHAKVGIVDDQLAFVGSYNLDPLSAGVNGEVVGALWSTRVSRHVSGLIRDRIAAGRPNVVEYKIARGADGAATKKDGKPVVVFGPDDHCTPEQLQAARKMEPMLELLAPLL
ncbi:MAG: phosphatidylserine/phosphatidylglycerophosphate/cardiolipin synthase family protein [Deltaproteobacteria bacterium]|nr:phosphatidylserine/phosphatidylglycerophosphate/cardiolipin synthase family protein [Deltaproteobacteria bacterium]